MDKNDKTVEFTPINDNRKEKINRGENNVYSNARKNSYDKKKEYEEKRFESKGMVYAIVFLSLTLIIAIIAGVIIISQSKKPNQDISEDPLIIEDDLTENDEDKEPEKTESVYNIIFYGETVKKSGQGYEIAADLYDSNFKKVGTRKIKITADTVIKESGKRMATEGFIYTIESLTGEMISIEGKIREKDNFAISLSYDGSFREELGEDEAPETEGNTPPPVENEDQSTTPPQEELPPVVNEGVGTPSQNDGVEEPEQ